MRVAVNSHALPIYKKNRIASLLCIFETTIVYMSLYDTRTIIEISSQITIMQFLSKSQVYSSVKAWETCSLRCTCSGTGGSIIALKPTRTHLQLSTCTLIIKKLIYCCKTLAFSDGASFIRSKKPSYWHT